ncbi:transcription factor [Drepanopeziza brunnea f. sp. 'multigermtubi' MB_m1]|uniref:Transcription factor n=2 Tax=Drepanopeziza brunnea f. sp. 'multigermtubi' TaxID=698441 RepID=K1X097_MARBU|nr:transcription factor [Drepanopeziza brunnea f. sp. 'multigermtubi' MB_m1]EKD18402.1 transcription factor [Drepanopeziza brunnea f. sp. 'multigermtubi' MB_m1]
MESRRHILPSSYTLPLEDLSGFSRAREPLANSAGNAQPHNLASILYNDSKGHQPRVERPMYSIPTVPSQPPRQSVGNTLELRRQSTRRQRHLRLSRNPIIESPQYQAYRARQEREGNSEESKWPPELEVAFLDALMNIPVMGRRKFSYQSKPHGRNELITEYIWIAYKESLPPGVKPDESMRRTRKQVSSHIQVLKAFLKDHPAYDRLFPPPPAAKNGFEDSYKNDPCLQALAAGRLPRTKHSYYEQHQSQPAFQSPIKPILFWLLMTSSSLTVDDRNREVHEHEQDLYECGLVAHKFTSLMGERIRSNLEALTNWRQKFPVLQQLYASGELNCDIIHMEAALNLLTSQPAQGSELCSRTVLSVPGMQSDTEWRTVTTLNKPRELYRDQISDPPMEAQPFLVEMTSVNDDETQIKIPFPASPWAQAFSCLQTIQSRYEERQQHSFNDGMGQCRPARDFVDQITMYQEVQSSAGPHTGWVRRAIILWTFRQATSPQNIGTTFRYLDVNTPARRTVMSPSPRMSHQIQASMSDNFNSWSDTSLHLQHPNLLDPFVTQGLQTPPHTAGLQSSFNTPNYAYGAPSYDLPSENLSFHSNTNTIDSETTLVDHNIDNFLSNSHVNLADFEPTPQSWQLPGTESFDADPTWALANYTVPSTTPALSWDAHEAKSQAWPDLPLDGKTWVPPDENGSPEKNWPEQVGISPAKSSVNYIEQSVEQKLLPWIEGHRNDAKRSTYDDSKDAYDEVVVVPAVENHHIPDVQANHHDPKAQGWHDHAPHDDFDYSQMEQLK